MQLVQSYRSHPAILKYPNEQFYGGRLQSRGEDALLRSMETSDALATQRFPIVFHAVKGKDQREQFSPSFFNINEATIVKKYVAGLLSDRKRATGEALQLLTDAVSKNLTCL